MIGGKKRTSKKSKIVKSRTPKIGDSLNFYDVGKRVNIKTKIRSFITKSNKKGRAIKLAVGKNKSGDKVYRIVANKHK